MKPQRSLRSTAEERVGRRCGNLRVLNSYWVNQDGVYKYFEVILVDPNHKAVSPRFPLFVMFTRTHCDVDSPGSPYQLDYQTSAQTPRSSWSHQRRETGLFIIHGPQDFPDILLQNRGLGKGHRHNHAPARSTWKKHNTLSLRRYR